MSRKPDFNLKAMRKDTDQKNRTLTKNAVGRSSLDNHPRPDRDRSGLRFSAYQ
jgi:hypothetical protein